MRFPIPSSPCGRRIHLHPGDASFFLCFLSVFPFHCCLSVCYYSSILLGVSKPYYYTNILLNWICLSYSNLCIMEWWLAIAGLNTLKNNYVAQREKCQDKFESCIQNLNGRYCAYLSNWIHTLELELVSYSSHTLLPWKEFGFILPANLFTLVWTIRLFERWFLISSSQ